MGFIDFFSSFVLVVSEVMWCKYWFLIPLSSLYFMVFVVMDGTLVMLEYEINALHGIHLFIET